MEAPDVRLSDGIGYYRARRAMRALRREAGALRDDLEDYIYEYIINEDYMEYVKRLAQAVCWSLGIDVGSGLCRDIGWRLEDYIGVRVEVRVYVDLSVEKLRDLVNEALKAAREGRGEAW